MRKNAGVGLWRSGAVFCLITGTVLAMGPQESGTDVAKGPVEEYAEPIDAHRVQVRQRMEQYEGADLETLKKAYDEILLEARRSSERVPEVRRQVREAYEEARLNLPEALFIQQEIRELEAQLDRVLAESSPVRELLEEIERVQQDMLVKLDVRTALGTLIHELDQDAGLAGLDEDEQPEDVE